MPRELTLSNAEKKAFEQLSAKLKELRAASVNQDKEINPCQIFSDGIQVDWGTIREVLVAGGYLPLKDLSDILLDIIETYLIMYAAACGGGYPSRPR